MNQQQAVVCFCPKDGLPVQVTPPAVPGTTLVCPHCLAPLQFVGGPFFEVMDLERMPIAARNQYERARQQMVANRIKAAAEQQRGKVVL